MTSPSVAQGLHGSGSRNFDSHERQTVVAIVQQGRPGTALTVEDLVAQTDVPGRTVRAVMSAVDGLEFLLGGTKGYCVVEFADDAESLTAALRSQIQSMAARLERRERMAQTLPRRQERLL